MYVPLVSVGSCGGGRLAQQILTNALLSSISVFQRSREADEINARQTGLVPNLAPDLVPSTRTESASRVSSQLHISMVGTPLE